MTQITKKTYTPQEVAVLLDISLASVYRRIEDGTFPCVQIGAVKRIPREVIDSLLEFRLTESE